MDDAEPEPSREGAPSGWVTLRGSAGEPDARLPAAYCGLCPCSEGVGGTAHGDPGSVEDMSVNHRRRDVFVSQQLLHGTDIIAVFQKVRGEGMAEGVRCCGFRNGGVA